MGQVIAVVANVVVKALAAIGANAGVQAAVGNFIISYGVQTLVVASSIAYSASQQRKLRKALNSLQGSATTLDQSRSLMVRDPLAPRCNIYGQVPVSGSISFFHQASANDYHYLVINLADHECEELGEIKIDNVVESFDGSGNATGTYAGFLQIRKFVGLAAGERDTVWESEIPTKWTADHLGKSQARLHIRITWDADKFPNGLPIITCMVKGKKLYDWRTSTTVYSANSALVAADWLMDTRLGKSVALARILDAEMQEAANICDETMILAESVAAGSFEVGQVYAIESVGTTDFTAIGASANTIGVIFTATGVGTGSGTANTTEKRYESSGVARADQDPNETFLELLNAMAGHACDTAGTWTIRAGAWRTPSFTFTDSDFVSSFKWQARQSLQDIYNGVRGTYLSPLNDWAPADFPVIKNDTYKAEDGGYRLWKDVAYNFTTSPARAQRLAKIDLEVGRQQILASVDTNLKGIQVQPGDVTSLTRANLGWSAKYFEVDSWGFKIVNADTPAPSLACPLVFRETAEGVWDWNDGEETTVDLAANTNLYDPKVVATPTGLTLNSSSHTVIQPDGTVIPKLKVSWTAPTDQNVLSGGHVEIEYKRHADSTWLSWADNIDGSLTEDFLTDVKAGVAYDVRIRFRNVNGVRSSFATVTNHTVSGDGTTPAAPTSVVATGKLESIVVDWARNTEDQLWGYEVHRNTANDTSTATKIWEGLSNRFEDRFVAAATTYYYWIKARIRSGTTSAFSSVVSATRVEQSGGGGTTKTLTITWHPSGLANGTVNGVTYTGPVTVNLGDDVSIVAPDPGNGDPFLQWSGGALDIAQVEDANNPSTIVRINGDITLTADY